jgi:hypothetical protein
MHHHRSGSNAPEVCVDVVSPTRLGMMRSTASYGLARLAKANWHIQAQILFLKSSELLPFRNAVNAAVESRHLQVRRLWDEMLAASAWNARKLREQQARLRRRQPSEGLDTDQ